MPAPKPSVLPRWATLAAWQASTYYAVGERVTNGGNLYQATTAGTSAASGGPSGTGGTIADGSVVWTYSGAGSVAWAGSTAYAVGERVTNDGGKLYLCLHAGTSAASGGPTGTAGAITDGSAIWAYVGSGTAQLVAPSAAQADVGWLPGQRPPAQTWNHLLGVTYQWLRYLNDLTNQALTWGAKQTFGKALIASADASADNAAVIGVPANNANSYGGAFGGGINAGNGLIAAQGLLGGVALRAQAAASSPGDGPFEPVAQFLDRAGNARGQVDRLGFVGNPCSTEYRRHWTYQETLTATGASSAYPDLAATIDAGTGQVSRADPDATDVGVPTVELQNTGGGLTLLYSLPVVAPAPNTVLVLEADVAVSVLGGSSVVGIGLSTATGNPNAAGVGAWIEGRVGSAPSPGWRLMTRTAAAGVVDGALAPSAMTVGGSPLTYVPLRLEIHGPSTPYASGGAYYVAAFLGAAHAAHQAPASLAAGLRLVLFVKASGGNATLRVTEVRVRSAHYLAADSV